MNVAKETIGLYEDDKILNMLERAKLVNTNEYGSEFLSNGKTYFVPNHDLDRVMPKGTYNEDTIGALLPGFRAGVIVNSYSPSKIGPNPSSYAFKLSQTEGGKKEKYYEMPIRKPEKRKWPRRLFSD